LWLLYILNTDCKYLTATRNVERAVRRHIVQRERGAERGAEQTTLIQTIVTNERPRYIVVPSAPPSYEDVMRN
jgi:hypothetical protein